MFGVNSWVSCAWFDFAYGLYLRLVVSVQLWTCRIGVVRYS